MLRAIALAEAHMECRYLKETLPVLTDLLAFEKVAEGPGEVTLKHPNTDWVLIVHEAGPDAPIKQMHNHFGVRVSTKKEVDAACEYLNTHKEKYGLKQIGQPGYSHGSYSLYFLEPGTNGWEIECYEDILRKEREWTRLGGIRSPHWKAPLPPDRFAGKGYVPQAFTHGTLACGDVKVSWDFYSKVLGLEVHQVNDHVVYVKHPGTKNYIVCAVRNGWKKISPNFRFTIYLESREAVKKAHRWLRESGKDLGATGLRDLETHERVASFLVSDADGNWWEVSCPN